MLMFNREQIIEECMGSQQNLLDFAKEACLPEEILNQGLRVLDANKEEN